VTFLDRSDEVDLGRVVAFEAELDEDFLDVEDALEDDELEVFAGAELPAGSDAADFDSDLRDDEAAEPCATTDPRILSIVLLDTPAFDRSSTDAYGRPSMIFFAVALPTPGSASICSAEAVFRSTGPEAAALSDFELDLDMSDAPDFSLFSAFSDLDDFSDFALFSEAAELDAEASSFAAGFSDLTRLAFATGLSFSIWASVTPARERSLIDE